MPPLVADLIALVGMVVAYRGSLRVTFATLVGVTFLVPAGLLVAHLSIMEFLPVGRLVLLAALAKLVVMGVRGELRPGLFDLTPVHAAFALFLGVALILGVALASPDTDSLSATKAWVALASTLLFFIVALALVRAMDDVGWALRVLLVVFVISGLIALLEWATKSSWNSWLYGSSGNTVLEADPLRTRGGDVRVRAASSFSLAYAWLLIGAVIAAITVLPRMSRTWRRLAIPILGLIALAGYLTYSRSVVFPVAVVAIAYPLLIRRPRLLLLSALTVGVISIAYLLAPSVGRNYTVSADQGSIDVRFERIPPLLASLVSHAYGGLGLTGLGSIGIPSTDATYLLAYGSLGVIGVTFLAVLQITTLAVAARGLFATDPERREIAAGCFLGIASLTMAGFAFDALTIAQVQDMLWLFAAIAVTNAERSVGAPRWLARPSFARVTAVAAAVGAGFLLSAAAPTTVAETLTFVTVPQKAALAKDTEYAGFVFSNSVCDAVAFEDHPGTDTRVRCSRFDAGPGQGQIRVEAPDREGAERTLARIKAQIYREPFLRGFQLADIPATRVSKPTALRTAPVWLPLLIGVALILLPEEARRTRRIEAGTTTTTAPAASEG